jgi:hypothetical protein
MRVCYNVHSHRNPGQLHHLVRTIVRGSPNSIVVISHDSGGTPIDEAALSALGNVVVQYAQGGYGDFTHVDRYFDAIAYLRETRTRVDWLVNLAGQHYPLRPLPAIEADLANAAGDGFVKIFPAFGPGHHWPPHRARSRYLFHHRRLARLSPAWQRRLRPLQAVNFVQPLVRLHVAYGLTVGWRVRSPFKPRLPLYGGSSFMSLSWPVVDYLWRFRQDHPELERHFRRTLSPEEGFLPTALGGSSFALINDNRRHFVFRGAGLNRSRTLGIDDVAAALASGAHFGGKFDMEADPTPIYHIDQVVNARANEF